MVSFHPLPERQAPSRTVGGVGVATSTPYRKQPDETEGQERKEEEEKKEEGGQEGQEWRSGRIQCGTLDLLHEKKANVLHPSTALALPVSPFVVPRARRMRKRRQETMRSFPSPEKIEKKKKKKSVGSAFYLYQGRDEVEGDAEHGIKLCNPVAIPSVVFLLIN